MAHHKYRKRGRTSPRKEMARFETKAHRMTEAEMLRGGTANLHWDYLRPGDLPWGEAKPVHRKKTKKPRPKKERCSVNRKHECLTEERPVERWSFARKGMVVEMHTFKMCVHCGKEWMRNPYRFRYNKSKWREVT